MWNLVSVRLKIVLVPVQDRCMVCTKSTIGSEIVSPDGKWNLVLVHLEIVLILSQHRCTVCAEHIIGSEIILDAPNSTAR
jgi:hypothetical protein